MKSSLWAGGDLLSTFAAAFPHNHGPIALSRAPGRVNLIGEHTDYNEGFVLPGAISFDHRVVGALNDSRNLTVRDVRQTESYKFDLNDPAPRPQHNWTDYVRGVQLQLERSGCRIPGADLLLDGGVPIGAGLSSSAALEVATALTLMQLNAKSMENVLSSESMDKVEVARLCQRAENEFVGARCGIMDQFSSLNGREGHAILLDCRSLQSVYVPLPASIAVVICNTMVRHSLAAGEYNQRRAQCEECVEYLRQKRPGIASLRDVTESDLQQLGCGLSPTLYRRARHVVSENARVLASARALERDDLAQVGKLMYQSHASLRDDYEVSCPELNTMVELAAKVPGTFGSRMTGGGFGGCTVSLIEQNAVDRFKLEVARGYQQATGICPDIVVTTLADGAGPLAPPVTS